jgi:hypothetical protein
MSRRDMAGMARRGVNYWLIDISTRRGVTINPTKDRFIFLLFVFRFIFSLSIANGLVIYKFGSVLSAKIFSF